MAKEDSVEASKESIEEKPIGLRFEARRPVRVQAESCFLKMPAPLSAQLPGGQDIDLNRPPIGLGHF